MEILHIYTESTVTSISTVTKQPNIQNIISTTFLNITYNMMETVTTNFYDMHVSGVTLTYLRQFQKVDRQFHSRQTDHCPCLWL